MAKMTNALKAALLSGLVFPGLGQIVLKHYRRGVILMLAVLACLAVIVVKAVQQALVILNQIQSEGGAISMHTISNAAQQASTTSDGFMINLVLLCLVLCWIIGIVDAYRIGKKGRQGKLTESN
jgi:TM2 domain-containing membrane protein YozV